MKNAPKNILNRYFAFLERRSVGDVALFYVALIVFIASGLITLISYNNEFLTNIPTSGGTLVEGIVGTPRFVNPVLAIARADHDIAALVYSGLMKIDHEGNLVPDIAESVELSEDGRTYHITLKDNVRFHDGSSLTARDVAFTISLIQQPDLKSPLAGNWEGVLVEELSETELNITLKEPYAPFIDNFTLGILPREIWDDLPIEQLPFSQHNTEPIGSGPYRITDLLRNKAGLINAYKLEAFTDANDEPNINTIVFNFYQNEEDLMEALTQGEIAGSPSFTLEQVGHISNANYTIIETPLPRTFAIYFNQNKSPALRDRSAREALEASIDKQALIDAVLAGHGIPIDTPIPEGFLPLQSASTTLRTAFAAPETILEGGGWQKNAEGRWVKDINGEETQLRVTLSTANTALFDNTATYIANAWTELGVEVQIDKFEQADLVQGIIRPRDFEALLFGADLGRTVDLYPFWHSSQKDDPGLNIAQYTNITADTLLGTLRTTTDTTLRTDLTNKLIAEIYEDRPAIFLFAPNFTYVIDTDVTIVPFMRLGQPSDRFANVADWHITSSNLWPIFSNN